MTTPSNINPKIVIWIWSVVDVGFTVVTPQVALEAAELTVPFARPEIEQSTLKEIITLYDFISIEISEGIEEDDYTCTIQLVGDWFTRIRPENNERFVFGVGVENRFFGVYDIESVSITGEYPVTTITGKVDLQLEETVFNHYGGIWSEVLHNVPSITRRIHPPVPLNVLIREYNPYQRWGVTYLSLMQGALAGATNLSSIRQVLKDFGLGLSPISYVTGSNAWNIYREIDIFNLYPVDANIPIQVYNSIRYERNYPFIVREPQRFLPLINIPPDDVIMSAPPTFSIPDIYNAPGRYQVREISIESYQFQAKVDLYASGNARPRIHLDIDSVQSTFQQLIEAKRWELQNTSAEAVINIKGNPNVIPRQRIQLFGEILPYPSWYITGVKHTFNPGQQEIAFRTTLKAKLFQGNWQSTQQPPIEKREYFLSPFHY